MKPQKKRDFLARLEKEGVEKIQERYDKDYYADEYKNLVEKWLEKNKKPLAKKSYKVNLWRLIIAIMTLLAAIIGLLGLIDKGE